MTKASLITTEHSTFYKVQCDGKERFYPRNLKNAATAEFDDGLSVKVMGFAVFDTTVSTEYAVALYGSKTEAEEHTAVPPAPTPETIFDDYTAPEITNGTDGYMEHEPDTPETFDEPPARKKPRK